MQACGGPVHRPLVSPLGRHGVPPEVFRQGGLTHRQRERSGAQILLALKCFAAWPVFDLMREYLDGTTSSSLYELKLGRDKFGGETHAYSVAWADHEIDEAVGCSDKIIFNSISQLERYEARCHRMPRGLRVNPGVSAAAYDLADPVRRYSRLGESDVDRIAGVIDRLDGFMIHNNCENRDFDRFDSLLTTVEERLGPLLDQVRWVSLGGGIHFTAPGYPLQKLAQRLRTFADRHGVQVYLEPGEAIVQDSASLEVTVLDVLHNEKSIAVVDSDGAAAMPNANVSVDALAANRAPTLSFVSQAFSIADTENTNLVAPFTSVTIADQNTGACSGRGSIA